MTQGNDPSAGEGLLGELHAEIRQGPLALRALYAEKHVVLFTDLGTPGIVDPGDVLRYTISVQNSASIPATVSS